jgi:predicted dehydrogenase
MVTLFVRKVVRPTVNEHTGAESPVLKVRWPDSSSPTVEDALFAAEIIEAMAESARSRRWVSLAR